MRPLVRLIVLAFVLAGCSDPPVPSATQPAALAGLPIRVTVAQRTTTPVPGSDGRLVLTVDDVTRGQIMASINTVDGTLLPVRSMSPGNAAAFTFDGRPLQLSLHKLDNALVGQDRATFEIAAAGGVRLTEVQKIERLLADVAALNDATFIRNGGEHAAPEAASHLRTKWSSAGSKITTARQFIDGLASASSVSGERYRIRLADGKAVDAAEFFNDRLRRIEEGQ